MTNSEILGSVFQKSENLKYDVSSNGTVTISEEQNHWVQNFLRKIKFKIPTYKNIELDEYGSYVFLQIDGKKNIEEIGKYLEIQFGNSINPLYERLIIFLNHIEVNCKYIEKIN
ncbi:PqqD family protein [Romboutsia sp.]|uniref:PqqD family protein n=1 Tax=Romboutsia sp. TaxID=1965302 RepID=UPI003F345FD6